MYIYIYSDSLLLTCDSFSSIVGDEVDRQRYIYIHTHTHSYVDLYTERFLAPYLRLLFVCRAVCDEVDTTSILYIHICMHTLYIAI